MTGNFNHGSALGNSHNGQQYQQPGGLAQKSPKRVRLVEFFRNREFEPEETHTIN